MLSRVANNLFWMGRYMERAEHLARYMKEIYFSSLDAPIIESYQRDFVFESMLYMAGIFEDEPKTEAEVLFKIGLDLNNTNSIHSVISHGRENARGARNAISTELWEAINKSYHFVNEYSVDTFTTTGLYEMTQAVIENSYIIRGKINGTLLHDETWAIILLGTHIERVIQVIRIINSKLNDIYKLEQAGLKVNELSFEWTTLLRCTESFDMNRKLYGNIPDKAEVLEFLILNQHSPRSINHCLQEIKRYLSKISRNDPYDSDTIDFSINKLCANYAFLTIEEIQDEIFNLLNFTHKKVVALSSEFEKKYLSV